MPAAIETHGPEAAVALEPAASPVARAHTRDRWPLFVTFSFGAALAVMATLRHVELGTSKYNLGNFTQAVWSTAHGRPFEATADTGEQVLRLGGHVEPILLLFAPLWWIWPSPLMLLTVQALALASGAIPVYWLALKHTDSVPIARRLSLAYLLYPSIGLLALNEFHAVALAIPFLLFAAWYLDEERLLPFTVCAVLAAATKEQIGLAIAGLGIWFLVTRRRWRAGSAIAAIGFAWSAIAFLVVIPHFSITGENPYVGRYGDVGGTPTGIVRTVFSSPVDIVGALATEANGLYLVSLVLPVAALCLLVPVALIPALPELAVNLLSSHDTQKLLWWQYVAGIVPFLFLATVYALRKFPARAAFLANVVVIAAAVTFLTWSPRLVSWAWAPLDREAAREALTFIPVGAAVSSSGYFGAQLAERERLLAFPVVAEAEWIIIDRTDVWIPWPVERPDLGLWNRAVKRYELDPAWERVYERGSILVLRRVRAGAGTG